MLGCIMLKRILIVVLCVLISFNCVSALICDNETVVKPALMKILTDYFHNHNNQEVPLAEIKDLIAFYKTSGGNCDQPYGSSNVPINAIIAKADIVTITTPICADGTEFAGCSTINPNIAKTGN